MSLVNDNGTSNYMKGYKRDDSYELSNLKKGNRYGSEGNFLGLTDLRTRLGYYTIIFLIFITIVFAVITGCSAALYGKIVHDDKGKEFKDNNKHWVEVTSWTTISLSGLFLILVVAYIFSNYTRFMKEDAALTDIGRIGLEPLEENEVHNSLTDLVANRANLNDYQRAQLRYNIGQGFKINNTQVYGNKLLDQERQINQLQQSGALSATELKELRNLREEHQQLLNGSNDLTNRYENIKELVKTKQKQINTMGNQINRLSSTNQGGDDLYEPIVQRGLSNRGYDDDN